MAFLKVFAGLVVGLLVVFFAGALLLPDEAHVSRSVVIDAPPEAITPYLVDFHRFNEWSPWYERDPETVYTFEGPDRGVGAKMHWQSDDPNVGAGTQTITAVDGHRRVDTLLAFEGAGEADARFVLEPQGDDTQVTWAFDTTLDGPVEHWFGLAFDSMIGADYEKGLAKLAEVVESQPAPVAAPEIEPVTLIEAETREGENGEAEAGTEATPI